MHCAEVMFAKTPGEKKSVFPILFPFQGVKKERKKKLVCKSTLSSELVMGKVVGLKQSNGATSRWNHTQGSGVSMFDIHYACTKKQPRASEAWNIQKNSLISL